MKNNTRKIISLLLVFFVTFAVTSNAWATTTYKYGQRSDRGSRPFNRDLLPIDIEVDKDEGKNPIAKFVLKDKSFRNDIVRLVIGEQDGKGIFYNDRIFYDEEIVLDNLEYNKKYFLQLIVNNNNGDIIETYTGNFIIENKPSRQVEISNTEKTNYKKYTEVHENRDRDFSRDNDKDSINSSIYRASGYGSVEENESNDEFEDANIIEGRVYKVIGTIDSRRDEDFFRKTFAQDGTMDIELGVPRNEDYDIYVYRIHEDEDRRARNRNDLEDECEQIAKGFKGEGTVERLRNIEVDREYVYYIKIVGFDGDYDRNDEYRLYIDSDYDPNAVRRDEYEKNNEADDASKIDVEEGRREEIYGTIHHEDDVDWYEFEVDGYSDLDIELNNIPRDCNYDIKLYRKDGRYTDLIESSRRSGDKSEDIRETVEKGTYYVKIYGDGYDDFDVEDKYELEIRYDYKAQEIYAPEGGRWVPDRGSSGPDGLNRQVRQITYLPYDIAVALKDTMNNIELEDYAKAGGKSLATAAALEIFYEIMAIPASKIAKVIQIFVSVSVGVNSLAMNNAEKEELQEVINEADENDMIKITTVLETRYGPLPGTTPTTMILNYYDIWNSDKYIEGEIGYEGDFDKGEYLPWDLDEESLEIIEKIERMD